MSSGAAVDFGFLELFGFLVRARDAVTLARASVTAMDAAMAGADAGTKAPAASERMLEGCEAIPRKTGIAYIYNRGPRDACVFCRAA